MSTHTTLVITCVVLLAYSIAATIVVILNNKEHQTCSDAKNTYHSVLLRAAVQITELERNSEIALAQRDEATRKLKEAKAAFAKIYRLLDGVVIDGGLEARKEAEKYLLSHPDAPAEVKLTSSYDTKKG